MPLTPTQIDALDNYSDGQQLKMWKLASIELAAAGVSYAINGRSLTRNDAEEVRKMIEFFEARINADSSDASGGIALVQYGERV